MSPSELQDKLIEASLSEFDSAFDTFQHSAFRLEMLSLYSVPEELPVFQMFLEGKEPPPDFNKDWADFIRQKTLEGKPFTRARVIDGNLTPYTKFEIQWAYQPGLAAGENIHFILRPFIKSFDVDVPILKDFWMFDEKVCFLMDYDYRGAFLGVTKLPQEIIGKYVELKTHLKEISLPLDTALVQLQLK